MRSYCEGKVSQTLHDSILFFGEKPIASKISMAKSLANDRSESKQPSRCDDDTGLNITREVLSKADAHGLNKPTLKGSQRVRVETKVTYANQASGVSNEFCENAEGPLAMSVCTVVENWVPPFVRDGCCQCGQHNTLNERWSVDEGDGDNNNNNNLCVANCSSMVSDATVESTIALDESCDSPSSDSDTSTSGSSASSAEEDSSDETIEYRDQNSAGVESETDSESSGRSSETETSDSSKSTTSSSRSDSSIDEILEEAMVKCSTDNEDNRYPLDGKTSNVPRPHLATDAAGSEPRGCARKLTREGDPRTARNGESVEHGLPFELHPNQDYDHVEYYHIMRRKELLSRPERCMEKHPELSEGMRKILVEWLERVAHHYKLGCQSLHLSVNILDRYLEREEGICRRNYQLVGVTSLLLATKQIEVDIPTVHTCVMLCRSLYTRTHLLSVERGILRKLRFELNVPTSHDFLEYYIVHGNIAGISVFRDESGCVASNQYSNAKVLSKVLCLARELLDIGIADYNFSQYLPSVAAEASLCIIQDLLQLTYLSRQLKPAISSSTRARELTRRPYGPNRNEDAILERSKAVSSCSTTLRAVAGVMVLSKMQASIANAVEPCPLG